MFFLLILVDTQTVSIESCSNATPTSPKTVTVSSSFVPELEVTSSVATPSSPGPLKHDRTSPIGDPYQQQGGKQSPLSVSHSRLTVKAVFEYEKKKKQAEKGNIDRCGNCTDASLIVEMIEVHVHV